MYYSSGHRPGPVCPPWRSPSSKRLQPATLLSLACNLCLLCALWLIRRAPSSPDTAASAAAATADEARLAHAEALLATLQSEAGVLHAALAASKQALEHSRTAVTTDELRRCWLTIGIPSVPRHVQQQRLSPEAVSTVANTSYLTSTLTSLLHELPADPTGAPCLL